SARSITPSKNQVTVLCASPGKIIACAALRPRVIRHSTVGSFETFGSLAWFGGFGSFALIPVGRFRDRASRPWRPAHAPVEGTQTRGRGSFPPHDPESRDTSGRDSRRTASSGLPPTCSTIVSNKQ